MSPSCEFSEAPSAGRFGSPLFEAISIANRINIGWGFDVQEVAEIDKMGLRRGTFLEFRTFPFPDEICWSHELPNSLLRLRKRPPKGNQKFFIELLFPSYPMALMPWATVIFLVRFRVRQGPAAASARL